MVGDIDPGRKQGASGHTQPEPASVSDMPAAWRNSLALAPVARPTPGPLLRWSRAVGYRLTELLNVCAAYLGIAVIVSVVMVFTIAPLREQASQIHYSLLMSLRPDNVDNVLYAMLAGGDGDDRGWLASLTGVGPSDSASVGARSQQGAEMTEREVTDFARLLQAANEEGVVAGISPAQERALRSYIARKYRVATSVVGALVSSAFVVAREMNLDPQLILAVIAIESRYNPYAESHVGAQGLMQVLTRVHKDKFVEFDEGTIAALHPIANMRVGSRILRDCIDRRGSVERGLACYVGATGPSDGGYGAKVLAERRRMALASGIPVGR